MSAERCADCGRIEGNFGCPVCDAIGYAQITTTTTGAVVEAWPARDPFGMPVLIAPVGSIAAAMSVAMHHEAPGMSITIPDPRGGEA